MRTIVVGAGITGVSTALWLRRDGHEVTLIDRIAPGDRRQTSYGNAGILAAAAVVPLSTPDMMLKAPKMMLSAEEPLFLRWRYLPRLAPWLMGFLGHAKGSEVDRIAAALAPLVGDSVEQHRAIAKGTPAERLIEEGPYVFLYPDRAAFEKEADHWELRRRHGFTWQEWDRDAIAERDPHIADRHRFATALDGHGWIRWPAAYVEALAEEFCRLGGTLRTGEITEIRPMEQGHACVHFEGGEWEAADRVVLAAGVWATRLAERLGHRTRMEAERGYHIMLGGASRRPPFPLMVASAKTAVTPMEHGVRFAGVAEFAGIEGPEAEPPLALIRRRIRDVYPDMEWETEDSWMGRRPSIVDSLPMLGRSPKAPGIIFAFGGQHLGLTMGPRLGRMAADIAADRTPNIDIAPYRVDRFDR